MENYNKELEDKWIEAIKQKEQSDKRLLAVEWVVGVLSLIVLFFPIVIGLIFPMEDWKRIVLVFSGFIPALIGLHVAMKIEQTAGYYECKHCKHKYVPTINAMYAAPHAGRTRYMRCPKCDKKSWQKKVLNKV